MLRSPRHLVITTLLALVIVVAGALGHSHAPTARGTAEACAACALCRTVTSPPAAPVIARPKCTPTAQPVFHLAPLPAALPLLTVAPKTSPPSPLA